MVSLFIIYMTSNKSKQCRVTGTAHMWHVAEFIGRNQYPEIWRQTWNPSSTDSLAKQLSKFELNALPDTSSTAITLLSSLDHDK